MSTSIHDWDYEAEPKGGNLHTEKGIVKIDLSTGLIMKESFYPKNERTPEEIESIKKQFPFTSDDSIKTFGFNLIEEQIIKHWKEDKSILQISNLTNIPRDKVIDIISDYVKMEFSHTQFK